MHCSEFVLTLIKIPLNVLSHAPRTHNHGRVKRIAKKLNEVTFFITTLSKLWKLSLRIRAEQELCTVCADGCESNYLCVDNFTTHLIY